MLGLLKRTLESSGRICAAIAIAAAVLGVSCNLLPLLCRAPVAKEDQYSYESGSTGAAGECQTTQSSRSTVKDKVQLTGSGFKQLRPWSAVTLRQVSRLSLLFAW